MGSNKETVDYIVEQVSWAGDAYTKPMFGEYCLYFEGKVVAFICDEQLFLKITETGGEVIRDRAEGEAYPSSKPYWVVSADDWDDRDYMGRLIKETARSVALPKKKNIKKRLDSSI